MSTTDLILKQQTVYTLREAISSFRNRQMMLFLYEYCLICYNKCLILITKQEKRACQHARQISVDNTVPRHKGPFWSLLFPLGIKSNKKLKCFIPSLSFNVLSKKCSTERKFIFACKVYNTYTVTSQRMQEIVGLVVE